jgi:hypothetical protein
MDLTTNYFKSIATAIDADRMHLMIVKTQRHCEITAPPSKG